jgi:SAM-dependent methyltransferase
MGYRVNGFAFEDFALRGTWGATTASRWASFEAVFSVGVLEHVREFEGDEAGSLREIRRVLRPGGHFVCYHFPNQHSRVERVNGSAGRHAHLYRYTGDDVRRLCAESGLELVRLRRYAALPRNVFGRLPTPCSAP